MTDDSKPIRSTDPRPVRPYRLKGESWSGAITFATRAAAFDGITRHVAINERYRVERRIGSRHSRKYETVAEGVRE